jgi:N-acetylglucosaminyl-diphospho-decaprenol L-rhamnosyltransferase
MHKSEDNDSSTASRFPVTVIILVYNTPDLLIECLQGFYNSVRAAGWQVLVIDNGSDKDIRPLIHDKFDGVDVIRSERNLGFSGGNNLGLGRAQGEFLILMNSDVAARPEMLQGLVEELRKNPRVGAMSPGLRTAAGEPQAYAFGNAVTPCYLIRRGIRRILGLGSIHNWATKEPIDVDWVSAACICVRRSVIEEVGNLDERFPLYFEDADWGMRMRAAGWRVVYNPLLQVTHLGGASQQGGRAKSKNLYYRSLLLFCEKHYGAGWKFILRTLLSLYQLLARSKQMILDILRPAEKAPAPAPRILSKNRGLPQSNGLNPPSAIPSIPHNRDVVEIPPPEFSIIMPVWNRAALVHRAVESVLTQSYKDFELIILDDGSEDDLEKAVAPYLSNSVIYNKTEHRGVAGARNAALSLARGGYIAYLDSDNMWDPRFLEIMREALNEGPVPHQVAYCMYRLYRKNKQDNHFHLYTIRGEEFDFATLLKRNYIDLNTLVHSRQAAEETGAWDESLVRLSDWDYVTRLASRFRPVFVPVPLVHYYFGVAENALTLSHREYESRKIILSKNKSYRHSITLRHDTVPYHFDHVSEKKYRNWIEMKKRPLDISGFAANGYPYMLQVEPTNRCNLACPFCPSGRRELGREGRDMSFEEYKPLVDDMADYLLLLVLYDWGEPLLNQDFPKMVRYANERGIRTMTSTNGHVLNNEDFTAEILKAGLDTLIVAVDSLDQKTYEMFRRNGNIQKVLEGIRKTVALKRRLLAKTRINMRTVVTRYNEAEIPAIRDMARTLGVDIFSVKSVNPNSGGLLDDDQKIVPAKLRYRRYRYKNGTMERVRINRYCHYVWTLANIDADGTVAACCYDYDGRMRIGNIHHAPFREIWNGEAARQLRRRIWTDKDSIPRCGDCDINFALSRGGWFPDYIDFSWSPINRAAFKIKRSVIAPAARRLLPLFQ